MLKYTRKSLAIIAGFRYYVEAFVSVVECGGQMVEKIPQSLIDLAQKAVAAKKAREEMFAKMNDVEKQIYIYEWANRLGKEAALSESNRYDDEYGTVQPRSL